MPHDTSAPSVYPPERTPTPLSVREAQLEIASILADLELSYGAPVVDLALRRYDMTSVRDERPAVQRAVEIVLGPVPGKDWMR